MCVHEKVFAAAFLLSVYASAGTEFKTFRIISYLLSKNMFPRFRG